MTIAKVVPIGLATVACGRVDGISRSIAASVHKGAGTRISLAEHTNFPWTRACIFGPYTPDSEVNRITGIQGAAERAYDIRENEGIDVLMFIDGEQVVANIAHPRRGADFGPEIVSRCYAREAAVFSVRVPPPTSWGEIGPP